MENITPPDDFSDIQCKNDDCIDGVIHAYVFNSDIGQWEVELVKCKFCNNN